MARDEMANQAETRLSSDCILSKWTVRALRVAVGPRQPPASMDDEIMRLLGGAKPAEAIAEPWKARPRQSATPRHAQSEAERQRKTAERADG